MDMYSLIPQSLHITHSSPKIDRVHSNSEATGRPFLNALLYLLGYLITRLQCNWSEEIPWPPKLWWRHQNYNSTTKKFTFLKVRIFSTCMLFLLACAYTTNIRCKILCCYVCVCVGGGGAESHLVLINLSGAAILDAMIDLTLSDYQMKI